MKTLKRREFLTLANGTIATSTIASLLLPSLAKTAVSTTSPMAGGIFYTKGKPGRWSGKEATHVPKVSAVKNINETVITINTPHPMDGYNHYITKHMILDVDFNFGGEKIFKPFVNTQAISSFNLASYKGIIYVMSVCNLHDTWVTAITI